MPAAASSLQAAATLADWDRGALERDGETFVPYWLAWELQEDAWFAAHPPRPDALVRVPDDPIRG